MIKTYEYTKPMNNVSHVLMGNGGNTVRFNFINGNIITKKLPECTLHGKYYQDLLENSDLVKKGFVRLVRQIEEPSDLIKDPEPTPTPEPTPVNPDNVISVPEVRSADELIAYVNEHYDKSFQTVTNAMKFATDKQHLHFPNYNPAQ